LTKEQLKPEDLNKYLLAQDNLRHMAAQADNVDLSDKLWEWAKEVISTDKLNRNPFLLKIMKEKLSCNMHNLVTFFRYLREDVN
jgi:hypothetical protein